jgi:hypothetical protein
MNKSNLAVPLILIGLIVLCCCVIVALGAGGYALYTISDSLPTKIIEWTDTDPGPTPDPDTIDRDPVGQEAYDTLALLEQAYVPENDYVAIACALKGLCGYSPTVAPPASPYAIGDEQIFWVTDTDTNENSQYTATLRYITPHVYFWVENSVSYNDQEMRQLIDTFEEQIYPTNREFFGSEWTPGVDGDPHLYILYTPGMGYAVAGYFASTHEYPPPIQEYSNTAEMFLLASSQDLGDEYSYGVLAHEFQHMIHWYQDFNEGELLDEGFSELATFLNGYDTGGFDWVYSLNPDINLPDWEGTAGENDAHYGANFLFVTYFLDRFGEDATQALVQNQLNGLDSVDATLTELGITDAQTGEQIGADDFFLDWTISNYLLDGSVGDGRYTYDLYPTAPQTSDTEGFNICPTGVNVRNVNQYGVDYIRISCPGEYMLHLEGSTTTRVVPAEAHSGTRFFWTNKGNNSAMTLTQEFDLRGVSGDVEMTYWTWYDIENDYDYVYVEASTDGELWEILNTPSGTDYNPTGGSYGWGYTGQSDVWLQETVDLSAYAGQVVSLRFEYITDMAVNGEGLLLDDISIPALDYASDFETDDGGWQAEGFVRIANQIPQTFRLALITNTDSGTRVEIVQPNAQQSFDIPIRIGQDGVNDVVLVVTATARYTRESTTYQFEIR